MTQYNLPQTVTISPEEEAQMKTRKNRRDTKILLRACPRCQGDLFPDMDEEDFACLQCGRRIPPVQLMAHLEGAAAGTGMASAA